MKLPHPVALTNSTNNQPEANRDMPHRSMSPGAKSTEFPAGG
jgi:hypothetical protein